MMTADVDTSRRQRRRQWRSQRRWRLRVMPLLVALVALAGALTFLYPTASAWINQYQQSQIIAQLTDEVDLLPTEGIDEALKEAAVYNSEITGEAVVAANTNIPTSDAGAASSISYHQQLAANDSGLMARLKIPSIGVDLPIYHGTSDQVLLQGVGHLEGTTLPIGGRSTHSVLTAHRGLASADLFTHLVDVEVGDTFTIEVFGEVLTYKVRETQVVEPSETELLRPVRGEDFVTLVTCTPLGINTQRILVTGERITPTPIQDIEAAGKVPEIPGFPWWALLLGGVLVVLVLYVWLSGRPYRLKSPGGVRVFTTDALSELQTAAVESDTAP